MHLSFVWMRTSETCSLLWPNILWWCCIMSCSVMWNIGLFARSRSQWGFTQSEYDCFCCIFWTYDCFADNLYFMVDHLKLKCLLKTLDCCVQVQSHCESSKFQLMFVCIYNIFWIAEPFTTKMVWWCISLTWKHMWGKKLLLSSANKVGVLMNCNCY